MVFRNCPPSRAQRTTRVNSTVLPDPAMNCGSKCFCPYKKGFPTCEEDAIIPCLRQETYMCRHAFECLITKELNICLRSASCFSPLTCMQSHLEKDTTREPVLGIAFWKSFFLSLWALFRRGCILQHAYAIPCEDRFKNMASFSSIKWWRYGSEMRGEWADEQWGEGTTGGGELNVGMNGTCGIPGPANADTSE